MGHAFVLRVGTDSRLDTSALNTHNESGDRRVRMRLKDKVILVTGSTTGIGEGMARIFAREGAKVMIHGRRKEAAEALTAELGAGASFTIGGLEDPGVPSRLIAETVDHFGRID